MALDKEYFDSIHIDVVKKKYYNAHKVEAVFSDIRQQAEAMYEENQRMHAQLDALNGKTFEIGDAILTAQSIYKDMLEKARLQADSIIAQAEKQRDEMLSEASRQQEYAVQRVESCYSKMKSQHIACIEAINAQWQDFLIGLYPDEKADEGNFLTDDMPCCSEPQCPSAPAPEHSDCPAPCKKQEPPKLGDISKKDIEARVNDIAKALFSDNQ